MESSHWNLNYIFVCSLNHSVIHIFFLILLPTKYFRYINRTWINLFCIFCFNSNIYKKSIVTQNTLLVINSHDPCYNPNIDLKQKISVSYERNYSILISSDYPGYPSVIDYSSPGSDKNNILVSYPSQWYNEFLVMTVRMAQGD